MTEEFQGQNPDIIAFAGDIVAAYVSNNPVPAAELPALIAKVHAALAGLSGPGPAAAEPEAEVEQPTPSQIRRSITDAGIVSFIDGKPYKTLKRHLTKHGLDMVGYRERYGLPHDYPSTSVNYSAARSQLARTLGLGRKTGQGAAETVAESAPVESAPAETKPARAAKGAAAKEAAPKDAAPKGRGRRKGGSVAEAAE